MIVPFCAPSGTGKTTFLIALSSLLVKRNRTVAIAKSTHHETLKEDSCKADSYKYERLNIPFLISSNPEELLLFVQNQPTDFVLVEGGRSLSMPSVVLKRGPFDPSWSPPHTVVRTIDIEKAEALHQTQAWLLSLV